MTSFPDNFLWGAATAAHQVEGRNHNQWTEWEIANADRSAHEAPYKLKEFQNWDEIKQEATNPGNYVSGDLADHYLRYEQDFDLLETMNMNAYRFSIEWSRVEPAEGQWDEAAIAHYRDYIQSLKRRHIEPVMTLLHFTLPVWFAEKGGFEKRENISYFTRFAKKAVQEFGESIRYIITINEPEVYAFESYVLGTWPPGQKNWFKWWRVINNQAAAHNEAADAIHAFNNDHQVTIAKNSNYFYPGDNNPISKLGAAVMQYFQDDYVLRKVARRADYLGINFYQSQRVTGLAINNRREHLSDVRWDLEPANIEYVLRRLYRKYKKPIMITENGLADADDSDRQWWIEETLVGMQKAMEAGVPLQGYFHWSLLDNFEWAYGKWPRFGLVEINYATGERALRSSAQWFGAVIKKARGR